MFRIYNLPALWHTLSTTIMMVAPFDPCQIILSICFGRGGTRTAWRRQDGYTLILSRLLRYIL